MIHRLICFSILLLINHLIPLLWLKIKRWINWMAVEKQITFLLNQSFTWFWQLISLLNMSFVCLTKLLYCENKLVFWLLVNFILFFVLLCPVNDCNWKRACGKEFHLFFFFKLFALDFSYRWEQQSMILWTHAQLSIFSTARKVCQQHRPNSFSCNCSIPPADGGSCGASS